MSSGGSNGGRLSGCGGDVGGMGVLKHISCNQQVYLANGAVGYACVVVFWSVLTATPGMAAALAALVA